MTVEALKQQFQDADREYQFALASGDPGRLTRALANWRTTFAAYNKVKRQQFKQSFVSQYSQR